MLLIKQDRFTALTQAATFHAPVWLTKAGSLGSFPMNSAVSIQLTATDPYGNPIQYLAPAGSLPLGLGLDGASGLLSGVMPAVTATTTFPFVVVACDNQGAMTSLALSITSLKV